MSTYAHKSTQATSETASSELQSQEIEVLKQMIRAYRANKLELSLVRPRFKKPRSNSGILVNDEIKRRALEMAKADPDATGGSLSGLVELLLWKYIGSPADVVEHSRSQK